MTEDLDSHNIARQSFGVSRRGYEQQEVRAFLHEVSSLVARIQREGAELRERAERAETRLNLADNLDETMLLEVLGEETTRVLASARDAAGEIRARAEADAERIVSEATREAAEARADAVRTADLRLAEAATESEALLNESRTELERRQAEAEDAATRILAEAAGHAQELRDEGQRDLGRMREEAEAGIEEARAQGRELVVEAQTVRARVLRDLAVRRKKARQQVEKLNAGRERLLQAYDVVRRTIDEATDELTTSPSDARLAADAAARRIETEPDPTPEQLDEEASTAGLMELSLIELDDDDESAGPFSGEVPAVDVPAPVPDEAAETGSTETGPTPAPSEHGGLAGRYGSEMPGLTRGLVALEPRAEGEGIRILAAPATEADVGDASPEADSAAPAPEANCADAADDGAALEERAAAPVTAHDPEPDDPEPDDVASQVPEAATDPVSEPVGDAGPVTSAESERVDPTSGSTGDADPVPTVDTTVEEAAPASVEDLVARLRAAKEGEQAASPEGAPLAECAAAEPGAESAAGLVEPVESTDAEPSPFALRDAALEPIERELGRRLKRALADEQNEVLDLLRRAKPKGVNDVLPAPDDHAGRWAEAVAAPLAAAAASGADWTGGAAGSTADIADELARSMTAPLRDRVDRSFAASDGDLDDIADRVRALYREWRGKRLTDTARHHVAAAYARGIYDALSADAELRWVLDPQGGPCPDCDDNVLGGTLTKGAEFPTGHQCAPAHPGCRCLVLATQT